ncbi:SPOR domain-containing protein [Rhodoferax sp. BAB1]|uniref:SPOR domain-containing protein n=1 Tax=Rhodoferax sp. BAB1 TaxID=2741720 RepID=UPI00157514B4|nr:SPOR domain-containing protein [Rhodoferax sp. BAB1]QKO23459.1 SPOR domain-containing protein [Rhodoferax sp. BAB1]
MLRFLVLLLVLLNAGYFAWSHGMLRAYGWAPAEQSEPQRLQQQIRPEAIRILPTEEARRAEQVALTPPKPPECLQAGLFDEAQTEAVRKVLETALPVGAWALETTVEPARWIVYMGKFPNAAALEKKRAELDKMKLKLQPLDNPELQLGLSLGRFETQAQAQASLNTLQRRGVRTARVVEERPETRQSLLRIPAADEALRPRLEELKPVLGDKTLRSCR